MGGNCSKGDVVADSVDTLHGERQSRRMTHRGRKYQPSGSESSVSGPGFVDSVFLKSWAYVKAEGAALGPVGAAGGRAL